MTSVEPSRGPTRNRAAKSGDSVDVVARVYHTENGNVHDEGDAYTVTDRVLAETLFAIGFVSIDGWTPPPEPPATATGATAGSPGQWTPTGSAAPMNLSATGAVVATPATAWTTGQHMVLGDSTQAHWNGTSWTSGSAAATRR